MKESTNINNLSQWAYMLERTQAKRIKLIYLGEFLNSSRKFDFRSWSKLWKKIEFLLKYDSSFSTNVAVIYIKKIIPISTTIVSDALKYLYNKIYEVQINTTVFDVV